MARHLYEFERSEAEDTKARCPHCKEERALECHRLKGAGLLGRLFLGMSPKTPCFRCTSCGRISQRLTASGKALVGLSWLPLALMFLWMDAATGFAEPSLLALTAGAFLAMGWMVFRVLRHPLYPVAGRAVAEEGRLYWGR